MWVWSEGQVDPHILVLGPIDHLRLTQDVDRVGVCRRTIFRLHLYSEPVVSSAQPRPDVRCIYPPRRDFPGNFLWLVGGPHGQIVTVAALFVGLASMVTSCTVELTVPLYASVELSNSPMSTFPDDAAVRLTPSWADAPPSHDHVAGALAPNDPPVVHG